MGDCSVCFIPPSAPMKTRTPRTESDMPLFWLPTHKCNSHFAKAFLDSLMAKVRVGSYLEALDAFDKGG